MVIPFSIVFYVSFFCFLRGEDFEDVLKVFLLVVIIATLVFIGLFFLVMLVKGNFYGLL